jgi:hypothetical protein
MRPVNDNGLMADSGNVTRRSLARMLAVGVAARQTGVAQAPPQTVAAADADLDSARELLRTNLAQIAKVKLPMATEPAFHFKA